MTFTVPTEGEVPAPPAVTKPWFKEDGTPTPEFARFVYQLRLLVQDLRNFVEQEHP